jgi:hypothetical protein
LIFSTFKKHARSQKISFSQNPQFHFKGPRVKKPKKPPSETGSIGNGNGGNSGGSKTDDEKRPRTAFSGAQLARLKVIFSFFFLCKSEL